MHRLLVLTIFVVVGCGGAVTGRAAGTCRVTYGSHDPEPTIAQVERTDTVTIDLESATGDDLRVTLPGCDLRASPIPGADGGRYAIASGHCRTDVPSVGFRDYDVRDRPADDWRTEDSGEESRMQVDDGHDVRLVFEGALRPGHVRYVCNATLP